MLSAREATILCLPPELRSKVCKCLSTEDFDNLALVARDHKDFVDNYKASLNYKIKTTYAVEEAFLESRLINGWLLPSIHRLARLRLPLWAGSCVSFDPEPYWPLSSLQNAQRSASNRRKAITKYAHGYLELLRHYSKRHRYYAKWIVKRSFTMKPSIQWDPESFYEAVLLWSTLDWPGLANVKVKVLPQNGHEELGAARSLGELPEALQPWFRDARTCQY